MNLRWAHMSEDTFSAVVVHLMFDAQCRKMIIMTECLDQDAHPRSPIMAFSVKIFYSTNDS